MPKQDPVPQDYRVESGGWERSFKQAGTAAHAVGMTSSGGGLGPYFEGSLDVGSCGRAGLTPRQQRQHKLLLKQLTGAKTPAPTEPKTAPPLRLLGHILYDDRSMELVRLVHNSRRFIDCVLPPGSTLQIIGNPYEVYPVYDSERSPELRAMDEAVGEAYLKRRETCGEDYIHEVEREQLIDDLKVPRERLPCIAWQTLPPSLPCAVLEIRPQWTASPGSWHVFLVELARFLQNLRSLARYARRSEGNSSLMPRFQRLLDDRFAAFLVPSDDLEVGETGGELPPTFQRRGAVWRIAFAGESDFVKHSLGMNYLQLLLNNAGREFAAYDLRRIVRQMPDAIQPGDAGVLLDGTALTQYSQRLAALEEDLAEARDDNDLARIEALTQEKHDLLGQIGKATGLNGRARRASDDAERARQSVSNAVRRAIKDIERTLGRSGVHLRKAVSCGHFLSYQPESPIPWRF